VLYDRERSMLAAARAKLAGRSPRHDFRFVEGDLAAGALDHRDADLTLALFALQFIRPHQRGELLADARRRARPGGALVVAEKVTQPSALWQEIANEATWDYKAERGVPASAIRDKARSIRGVLVPIAPEGVEALMTVAGWSDPVQIWRWHCWGLWAALTT
jgi:tRNA (cmo5U34)-methyltransferase